MTRKKNLINKFLINYYNIILSVRMSVLELFLQETLHKRSKIRSRKKISYHIEASIHFQFNKY